jgi:hypothetical protein
MHDNEYVAYVLIRERLRATETRSHLNFVLREAHRTDTDRTRGRWWRFALGWWRRPDAGRAPFASQAGRSALG